MSALLSYIQTMAGSLQSKAQNVLDSLFPPEKRAELFSRLQAFAVSNPKLSVGHSISVYLITSQLISSDRHFS